MSSARPLLHAAPLYAVLIFCPPSPAMAQPIACHKLDPNLRYSAAQKKCVCRKGYRAHVQGPVIRCCKPGYALRGKGRAARCVRSRTRAPCGRPPAGMVCVPRGKFTRGAPGANADQRPVKRVYLDAFLLDKHEVTVADYARCVRARACDTEHLTGSKKLYRKEQCNWGRADRAAHPINCVSWAQASAYCKWARKRLPTEAEWEKAARGARGARAYAWGDEAPTCRLANFGKCNRGATVPARENAAGQSPYGAVQMTGNVAEGVADYYHEGFYTRSALRNPRNTTPSPPGHVKRGGYFHSDGAKLRLSHRGMPPHPAPWGYDVGIRCAKDVAR